MIFMTNDLLIFNYMYTCMFFLNISHTDLKSMYKLISELLENYLSFFLSLVSVHVFQKIYCNIVRINTKQKLNKLKTKF